MRYAFVAYAFFISQIASAHDPVHLTNHNLLQETLGSPARPAMQDKTAYGGQEIGVASTIRVKNWKSPSGDRLTFESVLAQIAKLHVKKSFEQRTAHLKSWRETTNNQSGIVAPKLSDPLVNSVDGLAGSEHPMDTGAAALSSVSELLRLYLDGRGVLMNGLAGVPDLLSRYTTVSFTVSKDQSSFDESVAQPSVLDAVELLFEGPSTHLEGIITAKRLVVLSDEFTTGAGESTSSSSASQQSGSVSINLLNLTALPGVSYSESSETTERRSHIQSKITVDNLYIRVKDMVVKGTDIRAKVVDAIVENDLTIESLLGLFDRQADGFSMSSSGDMRMMEQSKRLEKIDALASFVGTEKFYLTVGGTLLTKSATFGLRPIGVVAEPGAERINAGRIIEEQLEEIDRDENMVINLPLGTIMTLAGQLNEIQKIKSLTYDQFLEEGLTEDEAAERLTEFTSDPEVKETFEAVDEATKAIEEPIRQGAARKMVAQGKGSSSSPDVPEGLYEGLNDRTHLPTLDDETLAKGAKVVKALERIEKLEASRKWSDKALDRLTAVKDALAGAAEEFFQPLASMYSDPQAAAHGMALNTMELLLPLPGGKGKTAKRCLQIPEQVASNLQKAKAQRVAAALKKEVEVAKPPIKNMINHERDGFLKVAVREKGASKAVKPPKTMGKNSAKVETAEKKSLLPREGEVGTFKDLSKKGERGDHLSAHHMPHNKYMKQKGVDRDKGVSMMVEDPTPGVGGRHRAIHKDFQKQDPSLQPREVLAESIQKAKDVYKKEGLYEEIRPNLLEVIKKNKELHPELFDKIKK